jgi:SPP1 family predicted phage head-tail adaptor
MPSKPIRAGDLRHPVTIQSLGDAEETDEWGKSVETWETVAEAWASIEQLSGEERAIANQTTPSATHRLVIRTDVIIDASMRVLFGSRRFDIATAFRPDEIDGYLWEVVATEFTRPPNRP